MLTASNLPNNIDTLKKIVLRQQEDNINLADLVKSLRRMHFAPKSEVVSSDQLGFFDEVEDIVCDEEEEKETITYERKKRGKRSKIPASLPRVEKVIDLSDEEKRCDKDGTELNKIGEEVSEQLNFIPAHIEVIKTIRPKYACSTCENIKIANLPPMLLPKTMATPSLVAYIMVSKFADYLPLYRQEHIFKRIGLEISRQTMARWIIQVCEQLMPLYNLLEERLLESYYLQMDETYTQVLKEKNKKATSKSFMWVRHKPYGERIILFDYDPTRRGDVAKHLLGDYQGYLQVDGYSGYDPVCSENKLIRLGCMNHARSKFEKAFKSSNGKGIGKKGLIYFKKLYKIEEAIKDLSSEKRFEIREEKSIPILDEMKEWIDEIRPKITPKSLAGMAINYAFNEWEHLTRFLVDGRLEMTNIWCENTIRPFAIGRRNFLFSDSVAGAESSAMIYSLIETAKANGIESLDYFNRMLEKLPYANELEDFENLLPLKSKFKPELI